ncbi:MAG TPA: copper-binding protein [Gallionella sp.]|nr:copper-binding protein [Gallionella sp.]
MRKLTLALGLAIAAGCATAQAATHEHDMSQQQAASQPAAAMHQGSGVLKAVNTGKVQIAHEPIAELGWPAMTMWFALRASLPRGLKAGDAVRFELAQENGKQWVIVAIRRK